MMRKVFMFVAALSLALFAVSAMAQTDIQTKGSISGRVVDTNGAGIPGATVKVTGPEADRSVTTNDDGLYKIDNLLPATYTVRVEKQGFKATEASNVTVYVGKTSTTDVTLTAGNISEVVNVTAGPGVDQSSTAT